MRTGSNNLVVIPNKKLSEAIYTNYQLPEARMGVSVIFNLAMDSDVESVTAILRDEVTAAVGKVAGLLAEPAPSVRFNGPGENGLAFQVNCNVVRFADQFQVLSDVRTLLYVRLRREGVHFDVPPKAVMIGGTRDATGS